MISNDYVCDVCLEAIAKKDTPIVIHLIVGTPPGTIDLDAEELEGEVNEYLQAVYETSPGIGGARVEYCKDCFDSVFNTRRGEIDRLKANAHESNRKG